MQQPQSVSAGNGVRPGVQPPEAGGEICVHAAEICPRLLDLPQANGERDVLFLYQIVAFSRLVQNDLVVLAAVVVEGIPALRHEHCALEVNRI